MSCPIASLLNPRQDTANCTCGPNGRNVGESGRRTPQFQSGFGESSILGSLRPSVPVKPDLPQTICTCFRNIFPFICSNPPKTAITAVLGPLQLIATRSKPPRGARAASIAVRSFFERRRENPSIATTDTTSPFRSNSAVNRPPSRHWTVTRWLLASG